MTHAFEMGDRFIYPQYPKEVYEVIGVKGNRVWGYCELLDVYRSPSMDVIELVAKTDSELITEAYGRFFVARTIGAMDDESIFENTIHCLLEERDNR